MTTNTQLNQEYKRYNKKNIRQKVLLLAKSK